ncbi:MAG: NAD-dependent epimerase/dehydratase family protein [Lachnospiraceae bacterium]|nr:NAD-dependent epimerase/dehydratase family protein [Lachnospiraceae bacterium]
MELHPIILEDLERITREKIDFEKLRDATVLITGINGMIASYITYTLLYLNETRQLNIKVLGLARNEEKAKKRFGRLLERKDFALLIQDITTPIQTEEKADFIIHAASQTGPRQFVNDPVGTIAANTTGTKNLLDFAVEKKSRGVLFLSTREIYGKSLTGQELVTEEEYGAVDPTLVRSCYPESKRMSETMCAAYKKQYGLNTKVIRIAHTYGPGMLIGDGRVVGDFLKNVIQSQDIVMNSDGSAVLGLTYISDLITGLFFSFLNFDEFVYNVSADNGIVTVKELANMLADMYPEKQIKTVFKEASPEVKAGYLANKIPLLHSKKAMESGWEPKVSLEEGFRRTVAYGEWNEQK